MRTTLLVALGVVVILGGVAGWIGARGLSAKASLEHAQLVVGEITQRAQERDIPAVQRLARTLAKDTANAAAMTSDPVWRAAEGIPWAGANLTAVRQLAGIVDTISSDAVGPIMKATSGGLDAFTPRDGRFDVELVRAASTAVITAKGVLASSSKRLDAIDTASTAQPVRAAVTKLAGLIDTAMPAATLAADVAAVLPGALGADGPRTYILLFQNNAESLSLGGNTAAWVILSVDDGALKITSQPSSQDFARDNPIPIDLPPELLALYNPDYFRYATNTTLRPDFPTAGRLAQAFWLRWAGAKVDGVAALDPIALSYFLKATGPLDLATGATLSADNAVSLLLSDVYRIYENPKDQDAFFAAAAGAVFAAMTSSSPDITAVVDAVTRSITEHRLMLWSAHPEEEAAIESTPVAGTLATSNDTKTEVGVFYVDNSASKMSYYLTTAATIGTTVCQLGVAPEFTVSTTLHSDISPEAYAGLSAYVRSNVYFDPVKTRTLVFVYGPPGTTFARWSWDGSGLGAQLVATGTDLGRPVAQIGVDLAPGESADVGVVFSAPAGHEWGPLEARVTPMVNPTAVTLVAPGCAAPKG